MEKDGEGRITAYGLALNEYVYLLIIHISSPRLQVSMSPSLPVIDIGPSFGNSIHSLIRCLPTPTNYFMLLFWYVGQLDQDHAAKTMG